MKLLLAALWSLLHVSLQAQTEKPERGPGESTPESAPEAGVTVPSRFPQYGKFMAIIEGDVGDGGTQMGSGGFLKYKGQILLFTNTHVLSGMQNVKITLLDATKLTLGNLGIAHEHDAAVIAQTQMTDGIEVMEDVDKNVAIGDEIVVLGNSKGAGVVTELPGKILALGPHRVEVSAAFVKGNSGSPIIHVKTGKAIGLATFSEETVAANKWDKGTRFTLIRHFGIRLDTIKEWDFPKWIDFMRAGKVLHALEQGAALFSALAEDIADDGLLTLKLYQASENRIRQPVTEFLQIMNRHDMAPQSVLEAKLKFLRDIAFATTANLPPVPQGIDWFQADRFLKELEKRKELKKLFEDLTKYQGTIGKITLP